MARICLTGAGGMLGQAFLAGLGDHEVTTLGRDVLDADHPDEIVAAIVRSGAEIVINCAAHTDLEAAEQEPSLDWRVNAALPSVMGDACRRSGAQLVHLSSTGCYGNWKGAPYTEADQPRPTTAHHRAKIAGEESVRLSGCSSLIIRTGWLFGGAPAQPKNFVWKRLREAALKSEMTSDTEQRGCPTRDLDVVRQIMTLLEARESGVFNVVATGFASRFDYVARIVKSAKLPCTVLPGPAFRRMAAVSHNETAINERLTKLGLDRMPRWEAALDGYVNELRATPEWCDALGEGSAIPR